MKRVEKVQRLVGHPAAQENLGIEQLKLRSPFAIAVQIPCIAALSRSLALFKLPVDEELPCIVVFNSRRDCPGIPQWGKQKQRRHRHKHDTPPDVESGHSFSRRLPDCNCLREIHGAYLAENQ